MALRTPSVLVSSSNEFDNLARYMHEIELNQQSASNVVEVEYSPSAEPLDTDDEFSAQPKT